tara:strand:+ start:135 stop:497 length:363 start_codon:yes stop_codon:yes gene_type:complete
MNDKTSKQSAKTQKTSKRILKPAKGSVSMANQTFSVDSNAMDIMFNAMPSQLQQALNKAELAPNNSINMKELNDWWIAEFIDTGIYTQDFFTVINHYRLIFRKTYKGFKPEELATLFTIS